MQPKSAINKSNANHQVLQQGQSLNKVQVGNLKYHIENWRKITSDPWIFQTVSGYHLEFVSVLPTFPNFSKDEVKLIDVEVQKLTKKGAITEVTHCKNEFISNIFLVPKKTGDFCPVINLKPLNHFVDKTHFKMENIQMVLNAISPRDHMVSLDLKVLILVFLFSNHIGNTFMVSFFGRLMYLPRFLNLSWPILDFLVLEFLYTLMIFC